MNSAITGSKYQATKNLDLAKVAKLLRADIAAAVKSGALVAGLACSVKISRYSQGQSMSVTITAFPGQVWTDEFVGNADGCFFDGDRFTAEAIALLETLEGMRMAYVYDKSDISSDHFDKRFYGGVQFSTDVTIADRARTEARLAAAAA